MRRKELARGLLARSVMLGLCVMGATACGGGGGGGNVRSDPPPVGPSSPNPPVTPPVDPPTNPPVDPNPPVSPPVNPPVDPPIPPPVDPSAFWHLRITGAEQAQQRGLTGKGVAIAFLDTGLDANTPALKGRVLDHRADNDPRTNDWTVYDKVGEGTRHASIGAGSKSGAFPGGIAPEADLIDWRLLDDQPVNGPRELTATTFPWPALAWAKGKARIYNVSGDLRWSNVEGYGLVGDAYSELVLRDDPATNALMVMALGDQNHVSRLPTMPGTDPALKRNWINVTGVSSTDPSKLRGWACGSSAQFCMVAPNDVMVPDRTTGELVADGGSGYAAAQVSGAAALVMQQFPQISSEQVQQLLLGAATDLGAPGVDTTFGWGLLNVDKAVNGPSTFAWGDFAIDLRASDRVAFNNGITGNGGLIAEGPGDGRVAILYLQGDST